MEVKTSEGWFAQKDEARFEQLMHATADSAAVLSAAQLEQEAKAAHAANDDVQLLRLLVANPGNELCYTSATPDMLTYITAAVAGSDGSTHNDNTNTVVTLGCGRGVLEWLLTRHFERHAPGVVVRSFELAGVTTDFFSESSVTRVSGE